MQDIGLGGFPGHLGTGSVRVGVDLCAVADVERAVADHGERYLTRVYTDAERAECTGRSGLQGERLAARFAAKEATAKALHWDTGGFNWRSIEVRKQPAGWCELRLTDSAAEVARRHGVHSLALSLSHEQGIAVAVVVAETTSPGPEEAK